MFTACPNCKTRFRVSAAQLKAAQGQVRCGKCHEVFDAFWALDGNSSDPQTEPPTLPNLGSQRELRTPLQDVGAGLSAEQEVKQKAVEPPSIRVHTADTPVPELDTVIRAGAKQRKEPEDEPKTGAPSMSPRADYPLADTPSLKAGPRKAGLPPIDDLFGDAGHLPIEPQAIEAQPTAPAREDHTTPEPQGTVEFVIPASVHAEDLPQAPKAAPKRPSHSVLWALGITLMTVVLLLQLVNANREALAQNPVLGPSLMALYSTLGRPLPPPRAVNGWDVSGLNVTSDPQAPGVLSITGALQNQAGFMQPWPLLRVELTDRFGQTLRGRDFKPADYLPAAQAAALLPVGQAARFRIDIADPGPDAVGFTLAPCLDLPSGRVCAASEHD